MMRLPSVSPSRFVGGDDRGTSTIEFLVVLPFLLLIMLASVEFSRAFMTVNLAMTAAREGARWGAVAAPLEAGTVGHDRAVCLDRDTPTDTTPPPAGVICDALEDTKVLAIVSINFKTVVPVFLPLLTSVDLERRASMRYEGDIPRP
jgi:TadE-like protein